MIKWESIVCAMGELFHLVSREDCPCTCASFACCAYITHPTCTIKKSTDDRLSKLSYLTPAIYCVVVVTTEDLRFSMLGDPDHKQLLPNSPSPRRVP